MSHRPPIYLTWQQAYNGTDEVFDYYEYCENPVQGQSVDGSAPFQVFTIKELEWYLNDYGNFWVAEMAGQHFEVHRDENSDLNKQICQQQFEDIIKEGLE